MTLSRRGFLAGTACLGSALPALADNEDPRNEEDGTIQPIRFRGPTGRGRRISGVVLAEPDGRLLYDGLAQGALRFNENRVSLNALIGGVFRPTIEQRVARDRRVGTVHLWERQLVLRPFRALVQPGGRPRLIIAHRQESWEPGRMQPVNSVSGLPRGELRQIGRLYRGPDYILAVLSPA